LPPIKSVKPLPFNTPTSIENAEVKRTRFGDKLMLTCEDFVVFLPENFSSLSKLAVEEKGNFKFVKKRTAGDNYTLNYYQEEE